MESTGRITRGVTPSARRILFGATADESIDRELRYITQVDHAHLVMLVEEGIVDRERACRIITVIEELRTAGFAPLRGREATRGVYLLYESYLIEQLGVETGGILHTARSRNDLNATVLLLRLRQPYLELLREALRLRAVLIRRARRFAGVTMPLYTHYQAALPATYGHYLAGIASALQRDCKDFMATSDELNTSPLGAGAGAGTSLPIRPARTAHLLGFDHPYPHSIDAVASRDVVLRMLAKAAILGVTLSRLATDLLLWLTSEFGFLVLPDHLVGSSSMMPQKRNPYLLEHVQGRGGAALGALVSAATAMHAKPFTNAISVGSEGVSPVWDALKKVTEATLLARLVVSAAVPVEANMLQRADAGYTSATELANRLVLEHGMPFRAAHQVVGSIVSEAHENDREPLGDAFARWQSTRQQTGSLADLDPASIARRSTYGGGAGSEAMASHYELLRADWAAHATQIHAQAQKWNAATNLLNEAVNRVCQSS